MNSASPISPWPLIGLPSIDVLELSARWRDCINGLVENIESGLALLNGLLSYRGRGAPISNVLMGRPALPAFARRGPEATEKSD